jgi:hypothetical protein
MRARLKELNPLKLPLFIPIVSMFFGQGIFRKNLKSCMPQIYNIHSPKFHVIEQENSNENLKELRFRTPFTPSSCLHILQP